MQLIGLESPGVKRGRCHSGTVARLKRFSLVIGKHPATIRELMPDGRGLENTFLVLFGRLSAKVESPFNQQRRKKRIGIQVDLIANQGGNILKRMLVQIQKDGLTPMLIRNSDIPQELANLQIPRRLELEV